jgi:F-type H+-transporting ATPase subunit gamma
MPGLKEVRIRIASVKSTQQITNAMKMVAASKLRKAQTAILRLRPYAGKLTEILQNLSSSIDDSSENLYTKQRDPKKVLLVVISSNRGLCGGFNSNIIKATQRLMEEKYNSRGGESEVSLICIGRKVSEFFSKRKYGVVETYDDLVEKISYEKTVELADHLMKSFREKEYDIIHIIYNQFKNAAVQRLMTEVYLPIQPAAETGGTAGISKQADYIFEPSKEIIIRELIPKSLRIHLYQAILDSYASEQGARMTAMQQATDNAQEIIRMLQISYNKARQDAITRQLLEIVAGAEALNG